MRINATLKLGSNGTSGLGQIAPEMIFTTTSKPIADFGLNLLQQLGQAIGIDIGASISTIGNQFQLQISNPIIAFIAKSALGKIIDELQDLEGKRQAIVQPRVGVAVALLFPLRNRQTVEDMTQTLRKAGLITPKTIQTPDGLWNIEVKGDEIATAEAIIKITLDARQTLIERGITPITPAPRIPTEVFIIGGGALGIGLLVLLLR